jgi:CHAT domain-containing protein
LGDYAKARELQERALAIYEKVLGPQHPDTAISLNGLATTYSAIGDLASARSFASRASAAIDRNLQSVLSMDEKSRLGWQNENLSMDVFASVLRPEQIAQLSLRWKGVVLASLMEDRALTMAFSKNKNSSKELQELQGLRTQLAKIAFDQNKKEEADKISEKIGAIQRSMASRSTGFGRVRASADLTVDTILPALSGGSVFVDFFEFNDPKLKGDERLHYGAILIAEDGTPVFIRIPDRMAIDSAADAIRTAVKNGDEQSLQENLATLSKKLWQPVAEKISTETKRIIVSPDGKLSFISFAALMDGEGKFICEKYLISYVASGRDLAKQDSAKENKSITLFANPKFDLNSTKKIGDRLAMRSSEISAFGDIQLPPLLGTEEECKALKQAAISTGWNPTTYVGAEATEQQIRSVKNTGILHLATHGFYLNAFTPAKDDTRGMSITPVEDSPKPQAQNGADPMRASGIALSGAQNTIKEWSKSKCPDPENDGILTAEEVAGLNLDGTWIVTLSACETGIGEARSGEGVFGLRRAFMMAGSKNLIMTLWAVNDASTAEIMADFYKRCFASSDASRSLAETQRDWLLKIKKDKGLLAAVRDAGPFVIATTGKP